MNRNGFGLRRGVILGASLLASSLSWPAAGQTPDSQAQSATTAQAPRVPALVTQTVDEGNRFTLRGNIHPMARAAFDRGAVPDSQPATRMSLVLRRSDEQEAALRQLLIGQQDKNSPNFHKWLTPDQFGKQFGPADTDIQAVTDWLTSRGFTGIKVSPGRTRVEFSGNVAQVRNAFKTEIHHFLADGKMHMANVSDPQIPAALSPVIAGVISLNDFRPKSQAHRLGTFRKTKATGEVKPLFTFNGCGSSTSPQPCYAVGPGDFRTIYNVPYVPSTMDGTGVSIAIVQDSNINVADVQQFRALFGLPANFTSSNIVLNGPDPGIQGPDSATGDEIEADLDVQWAGAVAPGATILLVVSQDSQSLGAFGTDLSAIYIIDNNIAPIMSESFGACEASLGASSENFYNALWQQASAQGITVILSSGDSGSAACDPDPSASNQDVAAQGLSVNGLASTIYNVAMGGTDFQNGSVPSPFWNTANAATTQISAKSYIPESTWNDSCAATAATGSLGPCTATIVNANNDPTSNNFGIDLVAAGGGPSSLTDNNSVPVNPKPLWQMGITGMPAGNFRQIPDISLFSGNGSNGSFYVICQQDANTGTGSSTSSCDLNAPFNDFQGVGGTSATAPAFAGIMAIVNQLHGPQGNANFVLYSLYKKNSAGTICASAAKPPSTCIFYDTVTGNNSVACLGGSTNCSNTSTTANQYGVMVDPANTNNPAWMTTTGYDNATGLGSLNVGNLLSAWTSAGLTSSAVSITSTTPSTINITHGTSVTFAVSVTPTSATGVVSLIATPPAPGSAAGIGSFTENTSTALNAGQVSIATSALPGGTNYPVVAGYSGDGSFAANKSAPVMVTVMPEASQTAVNVLTFDNNGNPVKNPSTNSLAYGSAYILQIAVSDSQGKQCASAVVGCPTGTVTLNDGNAPVNDFSGTNSTKLNSLGIADDQPGKLGVGTHSLVATYSGDNSFNASTTSPAAAVTITAAPTTTTVTPLPSTGITTSTSVTLTASVMTQSSGVGPTGTVTFSVGGTALGAAVPVVPTAASAPNSATPTSAFATATLNHTFTSPGSVTVTATYASGDGNYTGSMGTSAFNVSSGGTVVTTTVVTPSATTVASGGSVTFTAKVTGTGNNTPGVTGTVQFMNGTTPLGAAVNCTPTAGTSTTAGTCTATLMTTLSQVAPPVGAPPTTDPGNMPLVFASMELAAGALALLLVAGLRRLPLPRRLGYTLAGVLLLTSLGLGIAGCGGSNSNSGGGGVTPHTDSITAVYSGDTTYASSTSAAVSVSVQ
jgi:Pro-kumamolisin, activation domain/Bacterial Ig-like domain (group 3)